MFNPHPPLTGFPSALLVVALFAELASIVRRNDSYSQFGFQLVLVAVAIVPLTFFSGYWGAEAATKISQVSEEVIERHEGFARFLLLGLAVLLIVGLMARRAEYGRKLFKSFYRLLLLGSVGLVIYVSYLGGNLVFEHGAGVKAAAKFPLEAAPEKVD